MDTLHDGHPADAADTRTADGAWQHSGGTDRGGTARAITSGLLAGAAALASGELVAGFVGRWTSPVVAVAEAFVDRVPRPVKDFGIRTFGGDDKTALVVGILLVSGVCSIALGWCARRRPWLAAAGFVAFALVGAWSSQQLAASRFHDVVPSMAAGLAAVGALWVLRRERAVHREPAVDPPASPPAPESPGVVWTGDPELDASARANDAASFSGPASRRRFLARAGAVAVVAAGAAATGRALRARFSAAASRRAVVLPEAAGRLAPPSPAAAADGAVPFFTPNDTFYRVDTAVELPQVAAETWSLRITGMVEREVELTFDDVLGRALVEEDVTLTCVSNTVGGKLVGTARWLGLPLRELLGEAGISPDADQIVGRSVDGYTCGFPVAALDGRPALLAIGMNGEPLPIAHGFPARLVVAGLYGYVSATKWVTELEVTRFDRFDQYWVERGWDDRAPIKAMSRIDTPRSLARLAAGRNVIAGVAWAQTIGISSVEVSIDDGPWTPAELADELSVHTWRQWQLLWDAEPGRHRLRVRATDADGRLQIEERAEPFPNGASGWMSVLVDVEEAR